MISKVIIPNCAKGLNLDEIPNADMAVKTKSGGGYSIILNGIILANSVSGITINYSGIEINGNIRGDLLNELKNKFTDLIIVESE